MWLFTVPSKERGRDPFTQPLEAVLISGYGGQKRQDQYLPFLFLGCDRGSGR